MLLNLGDALANPSILFLVDLLHVQIVSLT